MITATKGIELREATFAELDDITRLRKLHDRPYVNMAHDVPLNITWWVALEYGRVVACMGFAVAPNRRIIIPDLYDDGTPAGKRGLSALIRDGIASGVKLYFYVPFDRPDLKRALERRGIVFKSWGGEYPA